VAPPPPRCPTVKAGDAADKGAASRNPQNHVVVGRHGIRIRPWPHPDPIEVMRAQRIMERVQEEQRRWYGVKEPGQVLAVTPTYSRAFQALHLTGLLHSLRRNPCAYWQGRPTAAQRGGQAEYASSSPWPCLQVLRASDWMAHVQLIALL
jgi:hypothetical protein